MKFFVFEALKNFKTSGTVTPSSKHLVRTCLKKIDWNHARFVLELGTGNGCITEEILKKGHKDLIVVSLEINDVFFKYSKEKYAHDPRLVMINESAFEIHNIIKKFGGKRPDIIVSSLPLTLFKDFEIENILQLIHDELADEGVYIQYQYSPVTLKYIKKVFSKVKFEFVLRNIPPAIVYRAFKNSN